MIKNYTLPVLVLLSGIFLSTISAYYSILGLISIFSGSALLITLMGAGLEMAKITSCLWLHKHWNDKIGILRVYLSVAVIALMLITSLGVYGFLTKANLKQSEGVNLNVAKVTALESNIQREQSRLDLNSTQVMQYNELLSKLTTQDVRRASNERRRIQSEIKVLTKESKEIAKAIDNLNTELLPYKTEINAVEVEVGTLLYISKLIYGEEYKEYLPQTLTVLTLLIIFVFDPLAIGLLIASQKSFRIINKKEKVDLKVELEDITQNTLDDFKIPNGNSSENIRNRVDEINKQVNKEAQVSANTSLNNDTISDTKITDTEAFKGLEDAYDEPFGREFPKGLYDNRWNLYENTEIDKPKIDDEVVDERKQEPDGEVAGRMRKGYRRT